MLSNVKYLEMLIGRACVGLHKQISGLCLLLSLGNGNDLAVHPADDLYIVVHDIL